MSLCTAIQGARQDQNCTSTFGCKRLSSRYLENLSRRCNSAEEVSAQIKELNDKYKSKDLVALEDHPMDPEEIDGVRMNHGDLILVVIQRLSKINKHSEMLKGGEYYDKWSQENLDDVVNWRFKK